MHETTASFALGRPGRSPLAKLAAYASLLPNRRSVIDTSDYRIAYLSTGTPTSEPYSVQEPS
jgi:hypothetical protein